MGEGGQSVRPPPMVQTRIQMTLPDTAYLKQVVEAIIAGMSRPANETFRDIAHTLVHWVKCMCFSSEKRMLKQLDIDHVR
jgi:hypothetical protein